jgi:hypothetical protein
MVPGHLHGLGHGDHDDGVSQQRGETKPLSRAEYSRAEYSRADQRRAEYSRAEQSRAERGREGGRILYIYILSIYMSLRIRRQGVGGRERVRQAG